jgi:glutamate-1-semialdehyde 2,1-aminomutase/spore coat polysaccharide biosynthesis protein SpsF
VQQELIRRGVLWNGFHNLCAAHTSEDIDYLLRAYAEVLPALDAELRRGTLTRALKGEPVEAVFRRTTQFNLKPKRAERAGGVPDARA